jgi:hypothetical protein
MFIMNDAQGRKGGSSDVKLVGITDDQTCLNTNSPTSLSIVPSATSSASPSHSATPGSSTDPSSSQPAGNTTASKSNTGTIIGGVLAGVGAVAVIAVLALFLLRRRRRQRSPTFYDDGYGYRPRRSGRLEHVDLDAPAIMDDGQPAPVISPYPFISPNTHSSPGSVAGSHAVSGSVHPLLPRNPVSPFDNATEYTGPLSDPHGIPPDSRSSRHRRSESDGQGAMSTSDGTSMTSSARRKAAQAGRTSYKPTRFIVHTDLEEAVPQDEGDIVELPPQYSERRGPLPQVNYTIPPPGFPTSTSNPLEVQESGTHGLQEPIQPETPVTPTPPLHYRS